jgi:hypothetical protein
MDAYKEICSKFKKLCPRLVPSPLWGLSIAQLCRIPEYLAPIFGLHPHELSKIKKFWESLDRKKCAVCGNSENIHIDEIWIYDITSKEIILIDLIPLCEKCHNAKHIGKATKIGKYKESLKHLANINEIPEEECEKLVEKSFKIYKELSKKICNENGWKFKIKAEIIPSNIKYYIEKSLNYCLNTKIKKKELSSIKNSALKVYSHKILKYYGKTKKAWKVKSFLDLMTTCFWNQNSVKIFLNGNFLSFLVISFIFICVISILLSFLISILNNTTKFKQSYSQNVIGNNCSKFKEEVR